MKKAKRIIGAVLIFALLALTLSACGKRAKSQECGTTRKVRL